MHCTGTAPSQLARAFKTKVKGQAKKFQFGVQVPVGLKQAMMLDKKNGNTLWLDSIRKELSCLDDHNVFKVLPKGADQPPDYQYVPYHFVFVVKADL